MIKILALYLNFEGAKNSHVLQVLMWTFGGHWRVLTGVWHLGLKLDRVTSLVFGTPMFLFVTLYLDFEGTKSIHVLKLLIWGFGGHLRVLTGVWHLDLDLDMVTGLWYSHVPNCGSLS